MVQKESKERKEPSLEHQLSLLDCPPKLLMG
jgi:hypothetical protein